MGILLSEHEHGLGIRRPESKPSGSGLFMSIGGLSAWGEDARKTPKGRSADRFFPANGVFSGRAAGYPLKIQRPAYRNPSAQ